MLRLKDKLGTRQLPTAEMILDGCEAEKLSDVGRGIADMVRFVIVWEFTIDALFSEQHVDYNKILDFFKQCINCQANESSG